MLLNFSKVRSKHLLSPEFRLVTFFFSITLFMLIGTWGILKYKSYSYKSEFKETKTLIKDTQAQIIDLQNKIKFINKQNAESTQIHTSNKVLSQSVKNLFDLIPERIVLTSAKMTKNSLVLNGITPNKEIYEFMLQAPLRSIFHRTYSSFYPIGGGWYSFVSTNYLDEDEL
jgi:Tfp pilus assembly protein PilN